MNQTPPRGPVTDRQIEAATVGDPKPYASRVVMVDYDPRRPAWFAEESGRVRAALGNRAVQIEHIGSTAVPGLAAKPIIDVLLSVRDVTDEASYALPLEEAGYVLRIREPEWHEHRVLVRRVDEGADRDVNLHVFEEGCVEIDRHLVFRDWLRANDEDRALYETTKRELAARSWKYVQDYADAKTDVVERIMARAGNPAGECVRR